MSFSCQLHLHPMPLAPDLQNKSLARMTRAIQRSNGPQSISRHDTTRPKARKPSSLLKDAAKLMELLVFWVPANPTSFFVEVDQKCGRGRWLATERFKNCTGHRESEGQQYLCTAVQQAFQSREIVKAIDNLDFRSPNKKSCASSQVADVHPCACRCVPIRP